MINLRQDYHVGFKGKYTIALHGNSVFTRMITIQRHTYDNNHRRISFVTLKKALSD